MSSLKVLNCPASPLCRISKRGSEMRRTVIAGNWKMNMTPSAARAFIAELAPMVAGKDKCDIVLCVPFVDIAVAAEAAKGTNIKIGAENVHFKASGAYTGEVAADMQIGRASCRERVFV